MALVWNPITKTMEDDGTGIDAAGPVPGMAPAAAPMAAPPILASGAGGGTTINLGQAPPERERTAGSQQTVKGPGVIAAEQAEAAASGQFLDASAAQAGVEQQEGGVLAEAAEDREGLHADAMRDREAIARRKQQARAAWIAEDEEQIKLVNEAHRAKNDAEIDFFKGRPAAEIFAALLRGVDRAVSTMLGQSGPTGVERILDAKIAAYKAQKLGEFQRKLEARGAKKLSHEEEQAALDQEGIAITNKVLAGLEVISARADKMMAQLTPQKAEAMRQQRDAAFETARANLRLDREKAYDRLQTFSETNRTGGAAGGQAAAVFDSGGNQVPVDPKVAPKLQESRADLEDVESAVQQALNYLDTPEGQQALGLKARIGKTQPARDLDGMLDAIGKAASKSDPSDRSFKIITREFTPGARTTMEEQKANLQRFLENKRNEHDARVRAASGQAPRTSAKPAPAAQGAPAAGGSKADAARAWLKANPNDPRAAAVRAKLQGMGGE